MINTHWENGGKWSIYEYGDVYRGVHKKDTGEVSYFEFVLDLYGPLDLKQQAEVYPKTYAKLREWITCIRCSTHRNLDNRPDYNNALMCDRCYDAVLNSVDGDGVSYEILSCGLKGKVIKDE